eukprot:UC4_evm1s1468
MANFGSFGVGGRPGVLSPTNTSPSSPQSGNGPRLTPDLTGLGPGSPLHTIVGTSQAQSSSPGPMRSVVDVDNQASNDEKFPGLLKGQSGWQRHHAYVEDLLYMSENAGEELLPSHDLRAEPVHAFTKTNFYQRGKPLEPIAFVESSLRSKTNGDCPIPPRVTERWQLATNRSMGLLPHISRAYIITDNEILFWNVYTGQEDGVYGGVQNGIMEPIVCILVAKPLVGSSFAKHGVDYVLTIATFSEIHMVGMQFDHTIDGDVPSRFEHFPKARHRFNINQAIDQRMQTSTDGMHITHMVATPRGQIFYSATRDEGGGTGSAYKTAHIFELRYIDIDIYDKAHFFLHGNKCRKLNMSKNYKWFSWIPEYLGLTQLFNYGNGITIRQMLYDDERHLLYVLEEEKRNTMRGIYSVRSYYIGESGDVFEEQQAFVDVVDGQGIPKGMYLVRRSESPDDDIGFVIISDQGTRTYYTNPMKRMRIRKGELTRSLPQKLQSQIKAYDTNTDVPPDPQSCVYADGTFIMSCRTSADGDPGRLTTKFLGDRLVVITPSDTQNAHCGFVDGVVAHNLDRAGLVEYVQAVSLVPKTEDPMTIFKVMEVPRDQTFDYESRKNPIENRLARNDARYPSSFQGTTFLLLTSEGTAWIGVRRLRDILGDLLDNGSTRLTPDRNPLDPSNGIYFHLPTKGGVQTHSTGFCGRAIALHNAGKSHILKVEEQVHRRELTAGLVDIFCTDHKHLCVDVLKSFGPLRSSPPPSNQGKFGQVFNEPGFTFMWKYDGICLALSRLLRPIWKYHIFKLDGKNKYTFYYSGRKVGDDREARQKLDILKSIYLERFQELLRELLSSPAHATATASDWRGQVRARPINMLLNLYDMQKAYAAQTDSELLSGLINLAELCQQAISLIQMVDEYKSLDSGFEINKDRFKGETLVNFTQKLSLYRIVSNPDQYGDILTESLIRVSREGVISRLHTECPLFFDSLKLLQREARMSIEKKPLDLEIINEKHLNLFSSIQEYMLNEATAVSKNPSDSKFMQASRNKQQRYKNMIIEAMGYLFKDLYEIHYEKDLSSPPANLAQKCIELLLRTTLHIAHLFSFNKTADKDMDDIHNDLRKDIYGFLIRKETLGGILKKISDDNANRNFFTSLFERMLVLVLVNQGVKRDENANIEVFSWLKNKANYGTKGFDIVKLISISELANDEYLRAFLEQEQEYHQKRQQNLGGQRMEHKKWLEATYDLHRFYCAVQGRQAKDSIISAHARVLEILALEPWVPKSLERLQIEKMSTTRNNVRGAIQVRLDWMKERSNMFSLYSNTMEENYLKCMQVAVDLYEALKTDALVMEKWAQDKMKELDSDEFIIKLKNNTGIVLQELFTFSQERDLWHVTLQIIGHFYGVGLELGGNSESDIRFIEECFQKATRQRFDQSQRTNPDTWIDEALGKIRDDIDAFTRQSRTTIAGHGERLRVGDYLSMICEEIEERVFCINGQKLSDLLQDGFASRWLSSFVDASHPELGYAAVFDSFNRLRKGVGLPEYQIRYSFVIMELADSCKADTCATRASIVLHNSIKDIFSSASAPNHSKIGSEILGHSILQLAR